MGFMLLMRLVDYFQSEIIEREILYLIKKPIASKISRNCLFPIHSFIHFTDNSALPKYGDPNYNQFEK